MTEHVLDGQPLPADAPPAYVKVAELLSAASGAPGEAELAGHQQAVAAFSAAVGAGSASRPRKHRRKTVLSSLLTAKLAIAAAAAAVPIGGLSAAAFTGNLPDPAQQFAHNTVGAPNPHSTKPADSDGESADATPTATPSDSPSPSTTAHGPNVAGPAAFGLCNAWKHGGLSSNSVPYANLVTAAGSKDDIGAFCDAVTRHGSPTPEPSESSEPSPTESHGKPSDVPRGQSDHHEGKPDATPSS